MNNTVNSINENTTNFVQRVHTSPLNQAGTPRRSWSTFAFNNKNFPDGKLTYESQQVCGSGSISPGIVGGTSYSKLIMNDVNEMSKYAGVKDNKFERCNQDVMARASQIVM